MLFLHVSLIAVTVLQVSAGPPQTIDFTTHPEAYAVYGALLQPQPGGDTDLQPPILLQAETEGPGPTTCSGFLAGMSGE